MFKQVKFPFFKHLCTFKVERFYRYSLNFCIDPHSDSKVFKEFDDYKSAMDSLVPSGLDLMFAYKTKAIDMYVIDKKTLAETHQTLQFAAFTETRLVISKPVIVR